MSRRKRQRLTDDGQDIVTMSDPVEPQQGSPPIALGSTQNQVTVSKTLFVHSLGTDTTTERLTEHFSQYYALKHATVVTDPVTTKCKGYGFATFADTDDARDAKVSMDNTILDDRRIKVDFAEPRHRRLGGNANKVHDDRSISKDSQGRQKAESRRPPKLIIRNLPWTFKDADQLAHLFRSYGKVKSATIPEKPSGLSAGFGFVTLRGLKNAEKALKEVNGKQIEGRTLAVDWAVEKEAWDMLQNQQATEQSGAGNSKAESDEEKIIGVASKDNGDPVTSSDYVPGNHNAHPNGQHSETIDSLDDTENGEAHGPNACDSSSTLFVRNVPFSATDAVLQTHFSFFGPVRYARVVLDPATARSRGTAFVAFYKSHDADACLRGSPRDSAPDSVKVTSSTKPSVLEDTTLDPAGRYTLDGRVLSVSRAVDRGEAQRLTMVGSLFREAQDKDKRRLYLLSEGTLSSKTLLYSKLSPMERRLREESVQQRQALVKNNPSLHMSLTRLSVRNLPRTVNSKDLKVLAREAVVGFATDVKAGKRQQLSKEELARGGEESKRAERVRKAKGKGIVKQAKIVFEGIEGSKIQEKGGAGRSRGYGFIEYTSHRWALMGLRWLNGHVVEGQSAEESSQNQKKRLIVEFAIENAQVVARRRDREVKAQNTSMSSDEKRKQSKLLTSTPRHVKTSKEPVGPKRRQVPDAKPHQSVSKYASLDTDKAQSASKLAKGQQVIGRKRKSRITG